MTGDASRARPAVDTLWAIVGNAEGADPPGSPRHIDLRAELHAAARARAMPDDAFMEKLERKAAIARTIYARYSTDWRAEGGPADPELLVRAAALLLIDAVQAADQARALKRLNAVFWIMDGERWKAEAAGALDVARIADDQAAVVADLTVP